MQPHRAILYRCIVKGRPMRTFCQTRMYPAQIT